MYDIWQVWTGFLALNVITTTATIYISQTVSISGCSNFQLSYQILNMECSSLAVFRCNVLIK